MTKSQESALLDHFAALAKEQGAGYLADALDSLRVPFADATRSDFPGGMSVERMLGALSDAQSRLAEVRDEQVKRAAELREAEEKLATATRRLAVMQRDLREIASVANKVASLADLG